ncbi:methyl-accepting chemotaxis protein [Teredinibacter sp. KSP-S5-2]|uniref:methyl-accepting chemotaxis protein n=1 Tax=Teredinibacter sp. KSP-S5-2 TaxID=3034506 RepID=UPI002934EEAA|nr:methyl-accepting chemotaxis protein [Teredinibacter sp. KSP-S5-2]WNO08406.1 methyl-accepting chemotaxis protein [Teredinibacter sp. KSP-S5-2]
MYNVINNWSTKTKIIGVCSILVFLLIFNVWFAVSSMNKIGVEMDGIAKQDIPLSESLAIISQNYLGQIVHYERSLRYGEQMQSGSMYRDRFTREKNAYRDLKKKVDSELDEAKQLVSNAIGSSTSEQDKQEFIQIREALEQIEKEYLAFTKKAASIFELLGANNNQQAIESSDQLYIVQERLEEELTQLSQKIEDFSHEAALRAEQHEHQAVRMMIAVAVISLILGTIFSFLVSGNIVRRLQELMSASEYIARGDLTHSIECDGSDEIGKLQLTMSNMQTRLTEIITKILLSSQQLAAATEELSATSHQANTNIQTQQSETSQVATAMNQMAATVQEVATNANETSHSVKDANQQTIQGQNIVNESVRGMESLAREMENAAKVITDVGHASDNIYAVLDVIKAIAEQTNLLALNAAIEAARAGEQGRGFAVVADEVRTLAGRTQDSTQEITQIIEQLQTGSKNAVDVMNRSLDLAKTVANGAGLAGDSLGTIARSINQIDMMSQQIASAAEEQSVVAEEMNRNITRISMMSDENSTATDHIATASLELAEISSHMQDMAGQFKL